MPKNNMYLARQQYKHRQDLRDYGLIARMQVLDKVTIALGRMGMSPECLAEFEDEYCKAEQDFCEEVVVDGEDDKQLVYSRYKIDRAVRQYVLPERFVPYDERYDIHTENRLRKLCFGQGEIKNEY